MKTLRIMIGVVALALAGSAVAQAQTVERKSLTIDGAKAAIAASIAEARRLNAPGGVIAVVDDGGNLMAGEGTDGPFAAGTPISVSQGRPAARWVSSAPSPSSRKPRASRGGGKTKSSRPRRLQ